LWWDPEAAAIVLREPWKEMVVTPFEIGDQVSVQRETNEGSL